VVDQAEADQAEAGAGAEVQGETQGTLVMTPQETPASTGWTTHMTPATRMAGPMQKSQEASIHGRNWRSLGIRQPPSLLHPEPPSHLHLHPDHNHRRHRRVQTRVALALALGQTSLPDIVEQLVTAGLAGGIRMDIGFGSLVIQMGAMI